MRENGRENTYGECLVEGKGGKKPVGLGCFLLGPTKMFSSQIRKKTRENKNGQKHPCAFVLLS